MQKRNLKYWRFCVLRTEIFFNLLSWFYVFKFLLSSMIFSLGSHSWYAPSLIKYFYSINFSDFDLEKEIFFVQFYLSKSGSPSSLPNRRFPHPWKKKAKINSNMKINTKMNINIKMNIKISMKRNMKKGT